MDRKPELAGVFVQGRGSKRSLVAGVAGGQVLGIVGSIAGHTAAERKAKNGHHSPLAVGQTGYLAVLPDHVTLFATERGVVRKPQPSDTVLATVPVSAAASATVQRGRISGALEIGFTDGSGWAFDVARTDYADADRVARAITPAGSPPPQAAVAGPAPVLPEGSPPTEPPGAEQPGWWSRLSRGKRIGLIVAAFFVFFGVLAMFGVGEEDEPAPDDGTTSETSSEDAGDSDQAVVAPPGFRLVENEAEGFVIALPIGFEQFEPGSQELDDLFDQLVKQSPNLAQSRAVFDESGVLYAMDLTSASGFKPTMNLLRFAGGPGDLTEAEATVATALESIGARLIATDMVELPAGEALRVESAMALANEDGPSEEMQTVQYIIPVDGSTWVVNLSSGDLTTDGSTFDQIIETFRVSGN
ncbi:MAG: hypothetical protein ACRD0U_09855 [Acidimicrobiales bacterium]